ncbi:unnamed protein product [Adineta ricciae]|uniref:Uncharacterized protein n=1 Tax=Adineta ricciae TaxID=249248 RepID=A0A814R8H7_ADIRI|nr:unnamed protein product [Adineta ricciae]
MFANDSSRDERENIKESGQIIEDKFRREFPQFQSIKIHPLLMRPACDINNFDQCGDKIFVKRSEVYDFGLPDCTKRYAASFFGWIQYVLKVLDRYDVAS